MHSLAKTLSWSLASGVSGVLWVKFRVSFLAHTCHFSCAVEVRTLKSSCQTSLCVDMWLPACEALHKGSGTRASRLEIRI